MNQMGYTGVVVMQSGKPIGILTDRAILRRFVNLNRKPEDVQVQEVMAPMLKIKADASVREALKMMVVNNYSRIGVLDKENLVGWITLTDAARESSKQGLVDMLLRRNHSAADDEMLCPRCRAAVMTRIPRKREQTLKWQPSWECPKCHLQD
jgi:predicted transcriptional regulator